MPLKSSEEEEEDGKEEEDDEEEGASDEHGEFNDANFLFVSFHFTLSLTVLGFHSRIQTTKTFVCAVRLFNSGSDFT